MDLFTISDLSRYSGIKAHTIRIWEQRYDALQPHRSEGNTRYYDGNQLRRLLNIVSLMDSGKKVSQLGSLSDTELFNLVNESIPSDAQLENSPEYFITQLISAGLTYDEHYFEKMFSAGIVRYGLKDLYLRIIYPMLNRIGMMWAGDTLPPPNEHFVSNLIKQKIYTAIDALPPPLHSKETWILFLPEGEYHEIGLLLANYLIRKSGRKVIYLGPDVPVSNISYTIKNTKPTHLLCFLVHKDSPENVNDLLESLAAAFKGKKIILATTKENIQEVNLPANVTPIHDADQLEEIISPPSFVHS